MRHSPDKHDHPDKESSPVVLVLDSAGLLARNYNLLSVIRSGARGCDWENEIECWDDIEPLDAMLKAVEPGPPKRSRDFIERGGIVFEPTVPPTASFQLTVMADTIGKLSRIRSHSRMQILW
jgi:hypothetical protein